MLYTAHIRGCAVLAGVWMRASLMESNTDIQEVVVH